MCCGAAGDNQQQFRDEAPAMVHIKSNLAPLGESLGFEIDQGQFLWTGHTHLTAERILADEREDEKLPIEEAEQLLRTILADGPVKAREIFKDAKENGISERTIKRAKSCLAISSKKHKFDGQWYWNLPGEGGHEECHEGGHAQEGDLDPFSTQSLRAKPSDPLRVKTNGKY